MELRRVERRESESEYTYPLKDGGVRVVTVKLPPVTTLTRQDLDRKEVVVDNGVFVKSYLKQRLRVELLEHTVDNYRPKSRTYRTETYDDYRSTTEPKARAQETDWIGPLVAGEIEQDRVFYRTDRFILVDDIDWTDRNQSDLHVLAFPTERRWMSLRDLTGDDIPELEEMMESGFREIEKRYQLARENIRCYLHYHPSYWWFHVHFQHVGRHCEPDRTHFLERVIENLRITSDYYRRVTLRVIDRDHRL